MPTIFFKRVSDGTYILWEEHQDPYGVFVLPLSFTSFKRLREQLRMLGFIVIKGKRNGSQELDH